jgi:phosphatidylinositol glycan class C protein
MQHPDFYIGNDKDSRNNMKIWRKNLYEKQPYSDNYIDPNRFFEQLDMTTTSDLISYKVILLGASAVAQQLSIVTIFIACYKYLKEPDSSIIYFTRLTIINPIILFIQYFLSHLLINVPNLSQLGPIVCGFDKKNQITIKQLFQNAFILLICLRVASPLLQTLTSSFSGDTIHALAFAFATLHLVFYDYILDSESGFGALSLNAAMFTAILLASRLHNIESVSMFMLLAVSCFLLYPSTSRIIKGKSIILHFIVTLILEIIASILLWYIDRPLFAIYGVCILFILLVCPLWLLKMQTFKKAFHGPWDLVEVQ